MTKKQILFRLELIFDLMNPKSKGIKFKNMEEAVDSIDLCTKYVMFDLEATKRELKAK